MRLNRATPSVSRALRDEVDHVRVPLPVKLMGTYVLVVGLVLVPSFFYLRHTLQSELRAAAQADLGLAAFAVRDRLVAAPLEREPELLATLAASLPYRLTVIDPTGRVLIDSTRPATTLENHASRPEVRQALAGGFGTAMRQSVTTGETLLYVAVRFPRAGPARGVVRLARPQRTVDLSVYNALRFLNRIGAVALSAAVLISLLAAVAAARPLRRIAAAARAFAAGDLGHVIAVDSDDEIGDAARALADLASQQRDKLLAVGVDRATLLALLDELPVGVVLFDEDRVPTEINSAARRLCALRPHHERERVTQLPLLEQHALAVARVLATGEAEELQLALPWSPERTLNARWLATFGPAGQRRPALLLRDPSAEQADMALHAALAASAVQLRAAAGEVDGRLRLALLQAADSSDAVLEEREVSAVPLVVEPLMLADLCVAAANDVQAQAEARGVAVDLPSMPEAFVAEAGGAVRRAVRELLVHAVGTAERGTTVPLEIDIRPTEVQLSVRGAGAGVDVVRMQRLLRPLGGSAGRVRDSDITVSWMTTPRA